MSRTTQCTKVPPGASGSSTTSAHAAGFAALSDHVSGGEISAPSQENSTGTPAPSENAVLVTVMVSFDDGDTTPDAPPDVPPDELLPQPATTAAHTRARTPTPCCRTVLRLSSVARWPARHPARRGRRRAASDGCGSTPAYDVPERPQARRGRRRPPPAPPAPPRPARP